jgi:acetylornithine/succinyldiaminopimelate/putrescine aminotransferase
LNIRQLFLNHVAQTSPTPVGLQVKKARGIYITALDGKKYIDLISGISVNNLGHRNEAVVKAIREQTGKYMHTMVYGEHIQHPQVALAQKLTSLLPQHLNSVFFTNSGTEAVEGAMKLAKRFTGRTQFVAMKNAYHGSTQGALSLMDNSYFTDAYQPLLPEIQFIEYNNLQQIELISTKTAAVFLEIIQSEAGYINGEPDFLISLKKRCEETGTLLVIDEIQTGMGRSGSMFAFEKNGILPDILLLAKGLGGGLPIGCFIASKEIMRSLSENPVLGHLSTFGGNPVCCAAGLAVINEITSKKLCETVSQKSSLFRKYLNHPSIKAVTGTGLMLGVHLESDEKVQKAMLACYEEGLLIDWFLHNVSALRIAPPLTITRGEIRKVCRILNSVLDRV